MGDSIHVGSLQNGVPGRTQFIRTLDVSHENDKIGASIGRPVLLMGRFCLRRGRGLLWRSFGLKVQAREACHRTSANLQ